VRIASFTKHDDGKTIQEWLANDAFFPRVYRYVLSCCVITSLFFGEIKSVSNSLFRAFFATTRLLQLLYAGRYIIYYYYYYDYFGRNILIVIFFPRCFREISCRSGDRRRGDDFDDRTTYYNIMLCIPTYAMTLYTILYIRHTIIARVTTKQPYRCTTIRVGLVLFRKYDIINVKRLKTHDCAYKRKKSSQQRQFPPTVATPWYICYIILFPKVLSAWASNDTRAQREYLPRAFWS